MIDTRIVLTVECAIVQLRGVLRGEQVRNGYR